MQNESYTVTVEVPKTPKDVFNCINQVSKWWTKNADEISSGQKTEFEGSSTKLNDEFVLRHGDVHYSKHKLVEVIPDKKIVWLVTDSKLSWIKKNKYEWTGTKMIIKLTPKGNKTLLHFTHEGLVSEKECYEHCVQFWDRVIKDWLFNFINGGIAI